MQRRSGVGLAIGLVLAFSQTGSLPAQPPAGFVGALRLRSDNPSFGGFSAIHVAADGLTFLALSDRSLFFEGQLVRDGAGHPNAVEFGPAHALKNTAGNALRGDAADSEGLAVTAEGGIFVSFEADVRVAGYDRIDAPATMMPANLAFTYLPVNGALEALAVDASGTLYAVPERPAPAALLPVYVFRQGAWRAPMSLPWPDRFRAVAADIGPDGRFYLLERRFHGLRGFSSRIRRFDVGPDGFSAGMTLLQTSPGLHDNLEGLSVWRARDGLRATMISDDNFFALQRSEIVEYRLPD